MSRVIELTRADAQHVVKRRLPAIIDSALRNAERLDGLRHAAQREALLSLVSEARAVIVAAREHLSHRYRRPIKILASPALTAALMHWTHLDLTALDLNLDLETSWAHVTACGCDNEQTATSWAALPDGWKWSGRSARAHARQLVDCPDCLDVIAKNPHRIDAALDREPRPF